jgi:hypothetical protein
MLYEAWKFIQNKTQSLAFMDLLEMNLKAVLCAMLLQVNF